MPTTRRWSGNNTSTASAAANKDDNDDDDDEDDDNDVGSDLCFRLRSFEQPIGEPLRIPNAA